MYEFLTGPLAWLSFGVFFIGLGARVFYYVRGLDWKLDRVTYSENVSYGVRGALRSIVAWLIPFGTRSWRFYPGYTVLIFLFHLGILIAPVFLPAHNILLKERLGFSLFSMPEAISDLLTAMVIIAAALIVLRRIAKPEVRFMTRGSDYLLLALVTAPFVTGFMAQHQFPGYPTWLLLHIFSGEALLVAIPFTRLSHFVLFFCSRAQIGMDYGIKRGGMKNRGLAW